MPIEIERKFLLADERWRESVSQSERLAQGYLDPHKASVRVRIGGDRAWLNIKAKVKGASRLEFEYPIPLADAEHLLDALALPGQIEKIRHHIVIDGLLWEIDEFLGANAGLVVAEVELPALDMPFERPPWLGREVTDEVRYYNSSLAECPWSQWPECDRLSNVGAS